MSSPAIGVRAGAHAKPWAAVALLVGAGIVSAFQVGKAPAALREVQADLALSLGTVSWLLSAFAIVGALLGVLVGAVVDRLGARRVLVAGLLLQGLASAAAARADGAAGLLALRVVEGVGFQAVVVAAPALIGCVPHLRRSAPALAAWATFMPVGMALMLLASAFTAGWGWRALWLLNAALLLAYAALAAAWAPRAEPPAAARADLGADLRRTLAAPGPRMLALLFAVFSAVYFAVFGFLPGVLSGTLGLEAASANALTALAVLAAAAGNLAGGVLLTRGVAPLRLAAAAFGVLAGAGLGIFAPGVPGVVAYAMCVLFSAVGGLVPAALFQAAPHHAPQAGLVGMTMGLLMQGNNVGLVVGPAAAGALVEAFGWPALSLCVPAGAAAAALLALRFAGASTRSSR